MKTLSIMVWPLILLIAFTTTPAMAQQRKPTAALQRYNKILDKRLAQQMRYSWFICNRWHKFSNYSPLSYCRQCSKVYKYDLSYEYHHDFQSWLKYRFKHSAKMVCQRQHYEPKQFKTFTNARDAHHWWTSYCGCSTAMM